jgi:hypothetical protein
MPAMFGAHGKLSETQPVSVFMYLKISHTHEYTVVIQFCLHFGYSEFCFLFLQNVRMEIPVSMVLEQPNSTASPGMTQAMIMSLASPTTVANNSASSSIIKSGDRGRNSPERCLSPLQQPDSTTDVPCSQQPVMTDSVDPTPLSSSQFIPFTTYSNPPALVSQAHLPVSGPHSESGTTNAGIINLSTCFSDTVCAKSTTPPHMICNTGVSGVNVAVAGLMGGNDQPSRDFSGNMFHPVNFMAQKSVQIGGSDLPLSGKY